VRVSVHPQRNARIRRGAPPSPCGPTRAREVARRARIEAHAADEAWRPIAPKCCGRWQANRPPAPVEQEYWALSFTCPAFSPCRTSASREPGTRRCDLRRRHATPARTMIRRQSSGNLQDAVCCTSSPCGRFLAAGQKKIGQSGGARHRSTACMLRNWLIQIVAGLAMQTTVGRTAQGFRSHRLI